MRSIVRCAQLTIGVFLLVSDVTSTDPKEVKITDGEERFLLGWILQYAMTSRLDDPEVWRSIEKLHQKERRLEQDEILEMQRLLEQDRLLGNEVEDEDEYEIIIGFPEPRTAYDLFLHFKTVEGRVHPTMYEDVKDGYDFETLEQILRREASKEEGSSSKSG